MDELTAGAAVSGADAPGDAAATVSGLTAVVAVPADEEDGFTGPAPESSLATTGAAALPEDLPEPAIGPGLVAG